VPVPLRVRIGEIHKEGFDEENKLEKEEEEEVTLIKSRSSWLVELFA